MTKDATAIASEMREVAERLLRSAVTLKVAADILDGKDTDLVIEEAQRDDR